MLVCNEQTHSFCVCYNFVYLCWQVITGAGHHVYADKSDIFNKHVLEASEYTDKMKENRREVSVNQLHVVEEKLGTQPEEKKIPSPMIEVQAETKDHWKLKKKKSWLLKWTVFKSIENFCIICTRKTSARFLKMWRCLYFEQSFLY